jgi:hypothetical protein
MHHRRNTAAALMRFLVEATELTAMMKMHLKHLVTTVHMHHRTKRIEKLAKSG